MSDDFTIPELPPVVPIEQPQNAILYSGDLTLARKVVSIGISLLLIVSIFWLVNYIDEEGVFSLRPSEEAISYQETYSEMIQLDDVSLDGEGISVCIVDSGIDMTHPDLSRLSLAGWRDFISNEPEPYDDNGHGTSMAGILVADGWIKGVAPSVDLYVAKALDGVNGQGSDEVVAQAIDWCVEQNVNVISLSLGGAPGILPFNPFSGRDSGDAASDAIDEGIVVVAAAGNDGGDDDDGDVAHPSSEQLVISVGGVTLSETHWSGSSIGDNDGSLFPLSYLGKTRIKNLKL